MKWAGHNLNRIINTTHPSGAFFFLLFFFFLFFQGLGIRVLFNKNEEKKMGDILWKSTDWSTPKFCLHLLP